MKITRNEQLERDTLKDMVDDFQEDRPAVSVSSMSHCLTKLYLDRQDRKTQEARGERYVPDFDDRTILNFATGLWLEKVILTSKQNADQGESEGITWHVDDFNRESLILKEIKSTRISLNTLVDKETGLFKIEQLSPFWDRQMRAYAYVKGVSEVYLTVIHLVGAYRPPFPELRSWTVEYSQEEINSNWEWLQRRKSYYETCVESNIIPTPFEYMTTFFDGKTECEWSHCPKLLICNAISG